MANTTEGQQLLSGYDMPVTGVKGSSDWRFYAIHITALTCIITSLLCASYVIIASFRNKDRNSKLKKGTSFFRWNKSQRLVVYLSLCDFMFNVSHLMDHSQMLITKDHVRPKGLCVFFAFMLIIFVSSQVLMINVVSMNLFLLIYKGKNVSFGTYDWKLLTWIFGLPLALVIVAMSLDQLGPNGASCFFDVVKGNLSMIIMSSVPIAVVFICNTVLYSLTWFKIYIETRAIKATIGHSSRLTKTSLHTARSLSLFVVAFFIQWTTLVVWGVVQIFQIPPYSLTQVGVVFGNIGGVLNAIIYKILLRQRSRKSQYLKSKNNVDGSGRKNSFNVEQKTDSNELSIYTVPESSETSQNDSIVGIESGKTH